MSKRRGAHETGWTPTPPPDYCYNYIWGIHRPRTKNGATLLMAETFLFTDLQATVPGYRRPAWWAPLYKWVRWQVYRRWEVWLPVPRAPKFWGAS